MLDFDRVALIVSELTALKFFPTSDEGRSAIVKLIGQMCADEDQVTWLVARTLVLCDEWPGPRTFRAIFCKRYRPVDGVDLRIFRSEAFPEGIPNERPAETPQLQLPPGAEVSAAPKLEAAVQVLAAAMPKMATAASAMRSLGPAGQQFNQVLEEILTPPHLRPETQQAPTNPNFRPITDADVERILAEEGAKKSGTA